MRHIAIVPAAGSGSRMGSPLPKQYMDLLGKPLLWHALSTLVKTPQIDAVYVVLAPGDERWEKYNFADLEKKLHPLHCGGVCRAASVTNALEALQTELHDEDWILVHDAARACLSVEHVQNLIQALSIDPVGGLLAMPVADTLKRSHEGRVVQTINRDQMWQAQTPQMFRYGLLLNALQANPHVTDEAGAIEAQGLSPRLIASDATNFKVTYPQDALLAAQVIATRNKSSL